MKWVILLLLLSACAAQTPKPDFQHLNAWQAKNLLEKKDEMGLFVLNVHAPYEGELDGTDAIIQDWRNIAGHLDQLPEDKDTPILVYCRTGRMSLTAIDQLKALGYTNLYHLDGGMADWDLAGFPVKNKAWT
jgi:rhodanese-related sulfurtransferase